MQAGVGRGDAVLCPVCGKVISGRNKRQNLQYHLITHTAHKPFKCPYCPHRANRSDNMKIHVRTRHLSRGQAHGDTMEAAVMQGQGEEGELPVPAANSYTGGFGCGAEEEGV